jgi:transposase
MLIVYPACYLASCANNENSRGEGRTLTIEQELEHNSFDGGLYAFINRRRDKVKQLFWKDSCFVHYYKSLSEDKFRWPKAEYQVMPITREQNNWLKELLFLNAKK